MTITDVRRANPNFFTRGNKEFFGDISYRVLTGKKTKRPYMIRNTYMWSDMFGGSRRSCWRINPLSEWVDGKPIKIENILEPQFKDLDEVRDWLKEN